MEVLMECLIIALFFILCILLQIFSPRIKGWFGEKQIAQKLSNLPQSDYETFNNIIITSEKKTSEIDHIVVSTFGIFVIETKNYKGWIFGNAHASMWTRSIYGHKQYFMNPIRQNYGHIQALSRVLPQVDGRAFIPIVAFSSRCQLKNIVAKSPVIYCHQILQIIKQYQDKLLSDEQRAAVIKTLEKIDASSTELRKSHVRNIRKRIKDEAVNVRSGICPKCNGKLKQRNGRCGVFYGCENYPRCKFTSDI